MNMQKQIAFPYTSNVYIKKEIIDILPYTIASKKITINKLTKEVKDFYNENLKSLKNKDAIKKIKMLENGKIFHAHRLVEFCF